MNKKEQSYELFRENLGQSTSRLLYMATIKMASLMSSSEDFSAPKIAEQIKFYHDVMPRLKYLSEMSGIDINKSIEDKLLGESSNLGIISGDSLRSSSINDSNETFSGEYVGIAKVLTTLGVSKTTALGWATKIKPLALQNPYLSKNSRPFRKRGVIFEESYETSRLIREIGLSLGFDIPKEVNSVNYKGSESSQNYKSLCWFFMQEGLNSKALAFTWASQLKPTMMSDSYLIAHSVTKANGRKIYFEDTSESRKIIRDLAEERGYSFSEGIKIRKRKGLSSQEQLNAKNTDVMSRNESSIVQTARDSHWNNDESMKSRVIFSSIKLAQITGLSPDEIEKRKKDLGVVEIDGIEYYDPKNLEQLI
ncbi:hypothetical protein COU54_02280 [Candidatus Pacearchaeota archaeon CG10_big_fil_rev_8_21_14_0_10_31_24]|nr:MAG: hypothetical protein COU54_02280 [Candidatus Pacearchaeota archaeon CG10_big_fil_rev_8_21_14_0_10_31_24]